MKPDWNQNVLVSASTVEREKRREGAAGRKKSLSDYLISSSRVNDEGAEMKKSRRSDFGPGVKNMKLFWPQMV